MRIRTLLAALAVTGGSLFGLAGIAHADPDVSQICSDHGDFGVSHGGCVSFFQSGNRTAAIADFCRNPDVQAAVDAKNHGECVNDLKALFA